MKENQINPVPLCTHPQSLLPGNECEVTAQFQQELLKTPNKCVFKICLRIFVFQIQKLEDEWIPNVRIHWERFVFD